MLTPLKLTGTRYTPEIVFDKEKGVFLISGISLSEEVFYLYEDAIKWLQKYAEDPNESTVLEIDLKYMNSSTVLHIARLIKVLSDIYQAGKEVKIRWLYNENDIEMQEHGEELEQVFNVPIELILSK